MFFCASQMSQERFFDISSTDQALSRETDHSMLVDVDQIISYLNIQDQELGLTARNTWQYDLACLTLRNTEQIIPMI